MNKLGLYARRLIYIICLGLLAGEFILHRHSYSALEATTGFFMLAGFVAFIIVVAGGVFLRQLISRPQNYYEDEER